MKGYYTSREVREVLGVGVGGVWEEGRLISFMGRSMTRETCGYWIAYKVSVRKLYLHLSPFISCLFSWPKFEICG